MGSKAILSPELDDEENKWKVKIDSSSKDKTYCGLTKRRLILVVGAVLVILLIVILLLVFLVKTHSKKKSKGGRSIPECQGMSLPDPIILISLDGFRPDYLDKNTTPNINYLASNGVRANFLLPQFPTKTFPNHYSMATGLFPVHSGIVANRFRDNVLNDSFEIGGATALDPKWWKGEPLWVTVVKQGLVSASYFWVGSEAPIEGILPNIVYYYNQSHPFEARVDKVLSWLDFPLQCGPVDPKKDSGDWRPSFITLYFHEPDYTAHRAGPHSAETDIQIQRVDEMIGRLWNGLKERSMQEKINIIVVGDHGMAPKSCTRIVYTDTYNVTLDDIYSPQGYGAFISMDPKPGVSAEEIVSRLKCKSPHFRVFLKENLPKRLHYSDNRRIGRIIAIPEDGWLLGINSTSGITYCNGGDHGYDNLDVNMRTFFVAHGPAFKKGKVVEHFQNTELYSMMADILGLKPAPNDGTPGSLLHLLDPTAVDVDVPESKSDGNLMRTDICRYPKSLVNCTQCICPWCEVNKSDVARYDRMLNFSDEQISQLQEKHLPWGVPEGGAGQEGCILTQNDFVTGYSTSLHLPLWVAYRLDGEKSSQSATRRNCFRQDLRLNDSQSSRCAHYSRSSFDRGHMAPNADFDTFDENDETVMNSFLLSNIAPQHHGFNAGIWLEAERMVRNLSVTYSHVYIISGSIFDENADGHRDDDGNITRWLKNDTSSVAIPTHYYKIILRCDTNKNPYYKVPGCEGRLDVISFILPHLPRRPCSQFQSSSKYFLENTARVRDIELLTGIKFFGGLPPAEQARIKTISPVELWV